MPYGPKTRKYIASNGCGWIHAQWHAGCVRNAEFTIGNYTFHLDECITGDVGLYRLSGLVAPAIPTC